MIESRSDGFTDIRELEATLVHVAREMEKLFQGRCQIDVNIHDSKAYDAADIIDPESRFISGEFNGTQWRCKEIGSVAIVLFKPDLDPTDA